MPGSERLVVLRDEHRILGQVEPEAVSRRPVPLGPTAGRDHVVHRFDDLVHGRARPRRGEARLVRLEREVEDLADLGRRVAGDGVARVVGDVARERARFMSNSTSSSGCTRLPGIGRTFFMKLRLPATAKKSVIRSAPAAKRRLVCRGGDLVLGHARGAVGVDGRLHRRGRDRRQARGASRSRQGS